MLEWGDHKEIHNITLLSWNWKFQSFTDSVLRLLQSWFWVCVYVTYDGVSWDGAQSLKKVVMMYEMKNPAHLVEKNESLPLQSTVLLFFL